MGDIVKFDVKKCDCGRTFLRLEGGIIGRADDMFQFGGVNIFPSAIENFVRETKEFSNEYQVIAPKMGSGKHLRIRVEPSSPCSFQGGDGSSGEGLQGNFQISNWCHSGCRSG